MQSIILQIIFICLKPKNVQLSKPITFLEKYKIVVFFYKRIFFMILNIFRTFIHFEEKVKQKSKFFNLWSSNFEEKKIDSRKRNIFSFFLRFKKSSHLFFLILKHRFQAIFWCIHMYKMIDFINFFTLNFS